MKRIPVAAALGMVWAGCGPLPVPVVHLSGVPQPVLEVIVSHGTPSLSPQTFTVDILVRSDAHPSPRGPWDCFVLAPGVEARVGGRVAPKVEEGGYNTTYDLFTGEAGQQCVPPRFRLMLRQDQVEDSMDRVVLMDADTIFTMEAPTLSRRREMVAGSMPLVVHPGEDVVVTWSNPQDALLPPGVGGPVPVMFMGFFQRGEQTGSWPATFSNGTFTVAVPDFTPPGTGVLSAGLMAVFPPVATCTSPLRCACTMLATGATLPLEVSPY